MQVVMDLGEKPEPARIIHLAAGEQAVINGALVTAIAPCRLELSPGACVFTGRKADQLSDSQQSAQASLYFALLAASADPESFDGARFRLLEMLGEVVIEERTARGQRECSRCAAAIIEGAALDAVESARRLAVGAPWLGQTPLEPVTATRFRREAG